MAQQETIKLRMRKVYDRQQGKAHRPMVQVIQYAPPDAHGDIPMGSGPSAPAWHLVPDRNDGVMVPASPATDQSSPVADDHGYVMMVLASDTAPGCDVMGYLESTIRPWSAELQYTRHDYTNVWLGDESSQGSFVWTPAKQAPMVYTYVHGQRTHARPAQHLAPDVRSGLLLPCGFSEEDTGIIAIALGQGAPDEIRVAGHQAVTAVCRDGTMMTVHARAIRFWTWGMQYMTHGFSVGMMGCQQIQAPVQAEAARTFSQSSVIVEDHRLLEDLERPSWKTILEDRNPVQAMVAAAGTDLATMTIPDLPYTPTREGMVRMLFYSMVMKKKLMGGARVLCQCCCGRSRSQVRLGQIHLPSPS